MQAGWGHQQGWYEDQSTDAGEEEGFGAIMAAGQNDNFNAAGPSPPGFMAPWISPPDVFSWLDNAPPFILQQVMYHTRWLLEQHGLDPDNPECVGDGGEGEEEEGEEESTSGPQKLMEVGDLAQNSQPKKAAKANKKSRHPGFGWSKQAASQPQQMQWTPTGWIVKDNSHKITSKATKLSEPDIVPPMSAKHPEAIQDRDKLKMLRNNVSMMQYEVNKLCKRFNIGAFNRDDLSPYPSDQKEKLETAVGCVKAAENTLNDFKVRMKIFAFWLQSISCRASSRTASTRSGTRSRRRSMMKK